MKGQSFTCFHCRETFRGYDHAQAHFGDDQDSVPACVLKRERPLLATLRKLECEADGIVFNLGENGPVETDKRFDRVWDAAHRMLDSLRPYRAPAPSEGK